MSEVREKEYNGKPLIGIYRNADDVFGFQFGVKKAELVLKHIDEIRTFVEKHTQTTTATK